MSDSPTERLGAKEQPHVGQLHSGNTIDTSPYTQIAKVVRGSVNLQRPQVGPSLPPQQTSVHTPAPTASRRTQGNPNNLGCWTVGCSTIATTAAAISMIFLAHQLISPNETDTTDTTERVSPPTTHSTATPQEAGNRVRQYLIEHLGTDHIDHGEFIVDNNTPHADSLILALGPNGIQLTSGPTNIEQMPTIKAIDGSVLVAIRTRNPNHASHIRPGPMGFNYSSKFVGPHGIVYLLFDCIDQPRKVDGQPDTTILSPLLLMDPNDTEKKLWGRQIRVICPEEE